MALGDFNAKLGSEFIPNDTHERSANGDILSQIIERKELIVVSGTQKCLGTWTRQNNSNEQEKSVIDYVLVNEDLYNYIDHMEIDEEKTFCPFRTTKLKNGVKTTYSDHNSIIIDFKLKKDCSIKRKCKNIANWKFTRSGLQKFKELTSRNTKLCDVVTQNQDIDSMYKKWSKTFKGAMHQSFKKVNKKTRVNNTIISRLTRIKKLLFSFSKS